jgi:hypothetical protein
MPPESFHPALPGCPCRKIIRIISAAFDQIFHEASVTEICGKRLILFDKKIAANY